MSFAAQHRVASWTKMFIFLLPFPQQLVPVSPVSFWGEGSPTIDDRKKKGYPRPPGRARTDCVDQSSKPILQDDQATFGRRTFVWVSSSKRFNRMRPKSTKFGASISWCSYKRRSLYTLPTVPSKHTLTALMGGSLNLGVRVLPKWKVTDICWWTKSCSDT